MVPPSCIERFHGCEAESLVVLRAVVLSPSDGSKRSVDTLLQKIKN